MTTHTVTLDPDIRVVPAFTGDAVAPEALALFG